MNDRNYIPTTAEAIDACRAGSDDLALAELRRLADQVDADPETRECFERSQQWDAKVGRAFRDVPAPAGLEERLLAAIAENTATDDPPRMKDAIDQCLESEAATGGAVAPADRPAKASRNRWKNIAIGGGVVASLTLAVVFATSLFPAPEPITVGEVTREAQDWWDATLRNSWNRDVAPRVVDQYPLPASLSPQVEPLGWQTCSTKYGTGVVYDLTQPGQKQALLFVIPSDDQFDLDRLLRSVPSERSADCFGVAFHNGLLYVLAVEGNDEQYYHSLFKSLNPVT